jgi:hypothetical protein
MQSFSMMACWWHLGLEQPSGGVVTLVDEAEMMGRYGNGSRVLQNMDSWSTYS